MDSVTFWEKHYTTADPAWGTKPNALLVSLVSDMAPGRVLDLGCGHGGDALWLAAQGWDVIAVDVSATALSRVAAAASEAGLSDRVHPAQHDLAATFPEGRFDLITASYFHTPLDFPRTEVLRRAAAAVNPGGRLLIVEHASVAPWSWQQDLTFPTPEESLAALNLGPNWTTDRCDAPVRTATGPEGQTAPVTDNVIVARRKTKP